MTPITDRTGRFSPLKTVALVAFMAPAVSLVIRYGLQDLGPLPVKEAIHVSGLWAIRFLIGTLALTPAMRISNWPKLALIRRMTGVASFAYALLHFALYIGSAKFALGFVVTEIASRFYLLIGFTTLVGLSLLAATSTDAALRRLGRHWKQLHRIVYGLAILGSWHFFLQSKIDVSEATLMLGLFLLLMLYRLAIWRRLGLSAPVLAGAAAAGAALTAVLEFAWYGLVTGVDPWRIAAANLMLNYGIRPAVGVFLAGLAIAAFPLIRTLAAKLPRAPKFRTA